MSKTKFELIKKNKLNHYVKRYLTGSLDKKKLIKKEVYSIENLTEYEKDDLWRLIVTLGGE